MRRAAALITILTAVPMLTAAPPPEMLAPVSPSFEIRIDVHPTSRDPVQLLRRPTPATYTCDAIVMIPDTKYIYTDARMVAEPGKPETVVHKFGEGLQLKFSVGISSSADEARAVAEISRGGQILTRQSSRILLQHPEKSVRPVE